MQIEWKEEKERKDGKKGMNLQFMKEHEKSRKVLPIIEPNLKRKVQETPARDDRGGLPT